MSLKPIDKAIFGMVSESPGRNESERTGSLESVEAPEAEPLSRGRRQHGRRSLTEAAGHSGGVVATAR